MSSARRIICKYCAHTLIRTTHCRRRASNYVTEQLIFLRQTLSLSLYYSLFESFSYYQQPSAIVLSFRQLIATTTTNTSTSLKRTFVGTTYHLSRLFYRLPSLYYTRIFLFYTRTTWYTATNIRTVILALFTPFFESTNTVRFCGHAFPPTLPPRCTPYTCAQKKNNKQSIVFIYSIRRFYRERYFLHVFTLSTRFLRCTLHLIRFYIQRYKHILLFDINRYVRLCGTTRAEFDFFSFLFPSSSYDN